MDKKVLGIGLVIVGVAAVLAGVFFITKKDSLDLANQSMPTNNQIKQGETNMGKTLVVYYSAQNHTRSVAERIAKNLGAETFEIVPKNSYTEDDLDWNASGSRVNKEHDDTSLRNIELVSTEVPNWDEYDTILLGYPIWWGIAAWPTDTFVKAVKWNGETIYPFCTSYSSGVGESDKLLKNEASDGNWKNGYRFYQDASDEDIKSWTDSLGE